jgi:hypothetical protein
MQGGRPNTGRASVNLGGARATQLHNPTQRPPIVRRPQPATPQGAARSGSREIARVDSTGLVAAGQQTGTPAQTIAPVQVVQPSPPPSPPAERGPSPPPPNKL